MLMSAMPAAARSSLHPLHAILLAFPVALFPAALIADITYLNTAEMQWSNLAAWAITGALLLGGPALLWAVVSAVRARPAAGIGRRLVYPVLLAVMWLLGLVNAFQHSRDGWSSVGTLGLSLSILSALCALTAAWIAHSTRRVGEIVR
jgi:uncharacterized membrane protein